MLIFAVNEEADFKVSVTVAHFVADICFKILSVFGT